MVKKCCPTYELRVVLHILYHLSPAITQKGKRDRRNQRRRGERSEGNGNGQRRRARKKGAGGRRETCGQYQQAWVLWNIMAAAVLDKRDSSVHQHSLFRISSPEKDEASIPHNPI